MLIKCLCTYVTMVQMKIKHFFTYCVFVYLCKAQFAIFVLKKNRREVGANDVLTLPDTILFQGTTSYYSIIVWLLHKLLITYHWYDQSALSRTYETSAAMISDQW